MIPRVLVTDAYSRSALTVIRSLGRRGIEITASDCHRVSMGFFSRYCSRTLVYPQPWQNPEGYTTTILREVRRTKYEAVIPMDDYSLIPLSRHKQELEKHSRFPFPEHQKLMRARDKALAIMEAKNCGIEVPETLVVKVREDLELVKREFSFPVILRPRESSGSRGVFKIESFEELLSKYQFVLQEFGPVIIQEYIPWGGLTYDVCVIMNESSVPRVVFVNNRLRTYPVFGGANVLGEGVNYPELKETAIKLLKALNWYGPAQVEFRVDPRDHRPKFMEINAALWGSIYLGEISDVDFPYLLYQLATNGDVEPVQEYKLGMRARWFFPGDILHIIHNPQRKRVIKSWVKDFFDKNTKMYIPSWDDPLPFLVNLLVMSVKVLKWVTLSLIIRR